MGSCISYIYNMIKQNEYTEYKPLQREETYINSKKNNNTPSSSPLGSPYSNLSEENEEL